MEVKVTKSSSSNGNKKAAKTGRKVKIPAIWGVKRVFARRIL